MELDVSKEFGISSVWYHPHLGQLMIKALAELLPTQWI